MENITAVFEKEINPDNVVDIFCIENHNSSKSRLVNSLYIRNRLPYLP